MGAGLPPTGSAGKYQVANSRARSAARRGSRRRVDAYTVFPRAPQIARSGGFSFKSTGGKELNFVDTALSSTAISTTEYKVLLNGLAQGTTASTRIGRRIQMKSIELKAFVLADALTIYNQVRFVIVLDKQANAAAPVWTDIYDAATPIALRNISNKARFWVLWDSGLIKILGNNATAGQQTDCSAENLQLYKRINIPVQYNSGSAGTVGDIQTNSLYFFGIGFDASGTADTQIYGNVRVRYDDS